MGTEERRAIVKLHALLTLIIPGLITLAAIVVQVAAWDSLPEKIATHWNYAGEVDGFSSPWSGILTMVLLSAVIPFAIGAINVPRLSKGYGGPTYRLMAALALGTSVFGALLLTWSVVMQAGLEDAADSPSIVPVGLVSVVVAVLAGFVAWHVQPEQQEINVSAQAVSPLSKGEQEAVAWFGTASMGRAGGILLGSVSLTLIAFTVIQLFVGDAVVAWILGITTVLMTAASAMLASFKMRVDASGISVRGALGWPTFDIAYDQVTSVKVLDVSAMGEFGGYGVRITVGKTGVITRSGEAVEIGRAGKRSLTVTIDDAETAAAVIEAYRVRS